MVNKRLALIAAGIFAKTNAHMAIQVPPPIPNSDSKSPLNADGSNFPCQGATLSGGTVTNLVVGQPQSLQFNLGGGANTAVHGGGSCQISVAYSTDAAALKNPSAWSVIHTYIGGCPTEAPGNLDQSVACTSASDTNCVDQNFTFTPPQELANGNAILAWTWFNNIGNREMYMNCAQVSISGGQNQLSALPEMFTANIGNGCSTTEQFNTNIPNPGKYVTNSALNYPLKAPQGTCQTGPGSSGNATTGSTPAPASVPSSAASSPGGGAFAEGASSAAAAPAAATTLATVASAAPASVSTGTSSPATGSSPGSCTAGQVACTASGFYCIDAQHFGMCDFGCATPMDVAAGTACTNGAIGFAKKEKRGLHIRHAKRLFRSY